MAIQITASPTANSQNSATTQYTPIDGTNNPTATEGIVQAHMDFSLNAANLETFSSTNTLNGSTTITARKGSSNVNLTITFASSTSGLVEDTAHSDLLTSGDLYNLAVVTAGSSGTFSWTGQSITLNAFGNTLNALWFGCYPPGTGTGQNSTRYTAARGNCSIVSGNANSNEANVLFKTRYTATWSNLRVNCTVNTFTGTDTVTSRLASAAGSQTVTVSASTTGAVQDTTHTDSLASTGTNIDIQSATSAGSNTLVVPTYQSWVKGTSAFSFSGGDDTGAGGAGATDFWSFSIDGGTTTEANAQVKIRGVNQTGSNLYVANNTNTAGLSTVFHDRDGGSNKNLTLTIGSNVTGVIEDTTHSTAYSLFDLINLGATSDSASIIYVMMGIQASQSAIATAIMVED